jgi:hypothetical protein
LMVMAMAKQQASGWGGSERCVDGMVGGVFVGVCVYPHSVCVVICVGVCVRLLLIFVGVCAPARLCEYVCVAVCVFCIARCCVGVCLTTPPLSIVFTCSHFGPKQESARHGQLPAQSCC